VRLDPRLRAALYVVALVLFVSGAAALVVGRLEETPDAEAWRWTAAWLLMVHGGVAMLMMVLLGALVPLHVRVAWRRRHNRTTGAVMLAANALLIVTAFGLYYLGSAPLRAAVSGLHSGIGLGLPVLWAWHVVRGRRRTRAACHRRSVAGSRGALRWPGR
jgi:hypothetical protein